MHLWKSWRKYSELKKKLKKNKTHLASHRNFQKVLSILFNYFAYHNIIFNNSGSVLLHIFISDYPVASYRN